MSTASSFKNIRILLLLCGLLFVVLNAWQVRARTTSWEAPLWVVVYPINADGSETTKNYIDKLQHHHFESIETFMAEQAQDYNLSLSRPVTVKVGPQIDELPPRPPESSNILAVMWWSLKTRYWASSITDQYQGPPADIQMFVVYYDPERKRVLDHSLGLQKGLLGVVNAFATRSVTEYNNVIITHELLHTVGASDKYNFQTHQSVFPQGYAQPDLYPLYPQNKGEVMSGTIPVSDTESVHPRSLHDIVIGKVTALEINWLQ